MLLDLAMYVYSFCPCFEHTQKVISMIVYMNDKVQFKTNEENHHKLQNLIRRYAFIFEKGNLNDLCNWFLFFYEFKISLLQSTERILEEALREENNPILWANFFDLQSILYAISWGDFAGNRTDYYESDGAYGCKRDFAA